MDDLPPGQEEQASPESGDIRQDLSARRAEEEKARIAEELLKKAEQQIEHKKILEQADAEAAGTIEHGLPERIFLVVGAVLVLFILPFLGYVNELILPLFAVVVCLVAGVTSPKKSYSPALNLFISMIGMLYFEYAAIIQFHTYSWTALFAFYQALAFDFLLATYFSMSTYRRKILKG